MKRIPRILTALGLLGLLAGCASPLPPRLQAAPDNPAGVAAARADEGQVRIGDQVRWGGEVVSVTNREAETEIEVLERPLDVGLRPRTGLPAGGRFIARVPGFVDPQEYDPGRLITVAGRFEGLREGRVGDHPYPFPVIAVEARYLWPPIAPWPHYYRDPFWDPFWYPWPHRHWRHHHHW